jgi:hypothetical protein
MTEDFFQQFHSEISKQSALDSGFIPFLSPSDTFAPPADDFDFELDNDPLVAAFKGAHTFVADPTPTFTTLRSECFGAGPASAFTTDSESAYDSFSAHSGSIYSPVYNGSSTYSLPVEFNLDFSKIQMDNASDYSAPDLSSVSVALALSDSFSTPSPDSSPSAFEMSPYSSRSSHSEYEPPAPTRHPILSSTSEYNPSNKIGARASLPHQLTISPSSTTSHASISPQLPAIPPIPLVRSIEHHKHTVEDPKKKYQCPSCPRAFARAFNLKTHRETHNPNRPKPHACSFPACGRSFSRKHDLGRHLSSIHRVDPAEQETAIGVERGSRSRCNTCGKSWVGGKDKSCGCDFEVR